MGSLRSNGVIVARSLEPALVGPLCQPSEPDREPVPVKKGFGQALLPGINRGPGKFSLCFPVKSGRLAS